MSFGEGAQRDPFFEIESRLQAELDRLPSEPESLDECARLLAELTACKLLRQRRLSGRPHDDEPAAVQAPQPGGGMT